MSAQTHYSLTSGPTEGTFEDVIASIQNYGFRQSVFEIEQIPESPSVKGVTGPVMVLYPSSTQADYASMKPGDKVHCLGLRKNATGATAMGRIRRMAEGTHRDTMTERK